MDYSDIFLWGLEENHKARQFYEKMGFVFSGNSMEAQIEVKKTAGSSVYIPNAKPHHPPSSPEMICHLAHFML